jgi:hypothetical protein
MTDNDLKALRMEGFNHAKKIVLDVIDAMQTPYDYLAAFTYSQMQREIVSLLADYAGEDVAK